MRYCVIGGAGFIGSHIVDAILRDQDSTVTVFDNLSSGKISFIEGHLKNSTCKFILGDILNADAIADAMRNHDIVVHLAANPDIRAGTQQTRLDFEINTVGTLNVLDAMRKNNVNRILFASSSTVFGEASLMPTPETYGPCKPISLYGASKLAAEGYITSYCHLFGFSGIIFRFANIVGPRATHGILFDFINKIKHNSSELEVLGNGRQRKSYLTAKMLAEAMLTVNNRLKLANEVEIINAGNDDQISVQEISEIFVEEMGLAEVKLVFTGGKGGWKGDVPLMQLDITKLKSFGWIPNLTSEQCIRQTLREMDLPI